MQIKLANKDLWNQFATLGNEMIITKKGRNMFPHLRYKVGGLEEQSLYRISFILMLCDERKYRFMNGRWDYFEPAEPVHYPREVFVGEPRTGKDLMLRGISFEKLKLTNGDDISDSEREHIRVQSLRKYVPILAIYKLSSDPAVPMVRIAQVKYDETQFIAVTAYQNNDVKDLKVLNNKYAQGFREGVQKRSSTSPPSSFNSSSDDSYSPPESKRARISPSNNSEDLSIPSLASQPSSSGQQLQNFEVPPHPQHHHPHAQHHAHAHASLTNAAAAAAAATTPYPFSMYPNPFNPVPFFDPSMQHQGGAFGAVGAAGAAAAVGGAGAAAGGNPFFSQYFPHYNYDYMSQYAAAASAPWNMNCPNF